MSVASRASDKFGGGGGGGQVPQNLSCPSDKKVQSVSVIHLYTRCFAQKYDTYKLVEIE